MAQPFATAVQGWFAENARDLPWRRADATPWGVLVSEVMLQQTPVARVLPVWAEWLRRWPTPVALAAAGPGDAVRAWGRLGYPRRALRLHATATAIAERHDGVVPAAVTDLRALPGIGDYTAAAVASFAYGARTAVLDTNVRRVYARVFDGVADADGSPTVAERSAALARVPTTDPAAYNAAIMELGALVCRARTARCDECPVAGHCRWRAAGQPPPATRRRGQDYAGTDRQARGCLLAVVREAEGPVPGGRLEAAWPQPMQRRRALAGLLADGLVERTDRGYRLPT